VRLFLDPHKDPVAVVTAKDVATQAQDEIHEVMGDDVDLSVSEERT
jgi:hypothetical protein